jgi:hypothetical protein
MGMLNAEVERFEICPITGEPASYNFPMTDIDGYEYKLNTLNPDTVIVISGNQFGDDLFDELRPDDENIMQLIREHKDPIFLIPFELY